MVLCVEWEAVRMMMMERLGRYVGRRMDGWDCVLVRRVLGSDRFCLATTHLVEKDVL